MVKKYNYNYKKYFLILDLDVKEEKEISDFLQQNRGKRNSYNDMLKRAIKKLIEEDLKNQKLCVKE